MVPIINERHFVEKLKTIKALSELSEWLENRSYLPKEGKDFDIDLFEYTIGEWNFTWYGFTLLEDRFLPL